MPTLDEPALITDGLEGQPQSRPAEGCVPRQLAPHTIRLNEMFLNSHFGYSVTCAALAAVIAGCAARIPTSMSLVRAPAWTVVPPMDTFLLAAHATRDGRRVVVVSGDGDVAVWQVMPRRRITRFQIPGTHPLQDPTAQIALDPSGDLLAVGGNDGRVHVWRLEPFALLFADTPTPPGTTRRLPGGTSVRDMGITPATGVALSADARTLAVGAGSIVMLWDVRSGERLDSLWLPTGSATTPSPVRHLAFSPSDGTLIIGSTDGWLHGVNPAGWEVEWKLAPGTGQPGLLVVDPTGFQFAVAGVGDSTVRLINSATRVEACRFAVPFVGSAAFSRNAHALVLGDGRSSVHIVDTRDCRLLAHFPDFAGSVVGVWFEPGCQGVIAALNVSPVLYRIDIDTTGVTC